MHLWMQIIGMLRVNDFIALEKARKCKEKDQRAIRKNSREDSK